MASPPSRLPPPIVERAPLQRPPLPDRFGGTRKVHTRSCIARPELPYESWHLRSPDCPAFGGEFWRAVVLRAGPARPVRAAAPPQLLMLTLAASHLQSFWGVTPRLSRNESSPVPVANWREARFAPKKSSS